MARPRKDNVYRDKNGKSRGEFIHPETIFVRERQLQQDGIVLQFQRYEGLRKITRSTATDRLAGSSLGRLYLRWQQGERINSIDKAQYEAGQEWGDLARKYISLMCNVSLDPKSASMEIGGGRSCSEPLEDAVLFIRRRFNDCRAALKEACAGRDYGRIVEVTYGVCVKDWPLNYLMFDDCAKLRLGLNAVGKALDRRY